MTDTHTHDCTGPDATCACGFVFKAARFCVSYEVYDNDTKRTVIEDGFNTDSADAVAAAFRAAADQVERRD